MADIMPAWVFVRRRDIELEAGFVLAGNLIVDEPRPAGGKMPKRVERDAAIIVEHLITFARSGQMRDDAMVFGWPKPRPPNADDFESDQALMTQWAKDRLKIAVRVDPRNDDRWRIDSETARQLGLSSDRFRH